MLLKMLVFHMVENIVEKGFFLMGVKSCYFMLKG